MCVMLEGIWSNFLLILNGVWNINTCPVEHRITINSCKLDKEGFAIYNFISFNSIVKLLSMSNKTVSVMLSTVAHGFHSSTRVQRQVDFHECEGSIVHIVSPRPIKTTWWDLWENKRPSMCIPKKKKNTHNSVLRSTVPSMHWTAQMSTINNKPGVWANTCESSQCSEGSRRTQGQPGLHSKVQAILS